MQRPPGAPHQYSSGAHGRTQQPPMAMPAGTPLPLRVQSTPSPQAPPGGRLALTALPVAPTALGVIPAPPTPLLPPSELGLEDSAGSRQQTKEIDQSEAAPTPAHQLPSGPAFARSPKLFPMSPQQHQPYAFPPPMYSQRLGPTDIIPPRPSAGAIPSFPGTVQPLLFRTASAPTLPKPSPKAGEGRRGIYRSELFEAGLACIQFPVPEARVDISYTPPGALSFLSGTAPPPAQPTRAVSLFRFRYSSEEDLLEACSGRVYRMFFGQIGLTVDAEMLGWTIHQLTQGTVVPLLVIKKAWSCFIGYFGSDAERTYLLSFHERVLFDQGGFWIARTEAQAATLRDYLHRFAVGIGKIKGVRLPRHCMVLRRDPEDTAGLDFEGGRDPGH